MFLNDVFYLLIHMLYLINMFRSLKKKHLAIRETGVKKKTHLVLMLFKCVKGVFHQGSNKDLDIKFALFSSYISDLWKFLFI